MERDELKALILECLAIHDDRKPRRRKKATVPTEEPLVARAPATPFGEIADAWADALGVPPMGRLAKALTPLLAPYEPKWIVAGIRAYAAEHHREGTMRYASPENFAGRASGYILPTIPSNELTEAEAALIGMTDSREHSEMLGLLTDRARG